MRTTSTQLQKLAIQFGRAVAFTAASLSDTPSPGIQVGVRLLLQYLTTVTARPAWSPVQRVMDCLDTWYGPTFPSTVTEVSQPCCPAWIPPQVCNTREAHAQRKGLAQVERPEVNLVAMRALSPGTCCLMARAHGTPATWPILDTGILGLPFYTPGLQPNVYWTTHFCETCGCSTLTLITTKLVRNNDLLIAMPPPETIIRPITTQSRWKISFDGGARTQHGTLCLPDGSPNASGAGVSLWYRGEFCNEFQSVAQMAIALPDTPWAIEAEAHGAAWGVALLRVVLGRPPPIEFMGDNLPILRLLSGEGKLTSPQVNNILAASIQHIQDWQWKVDWYAVRRAFNKMADALATLGVDEALRQTLSGQRRVVAQVWIDPVAFPHACPVFNIPYPHHIILSDSVLCVASQAFL